MEIDGININANIEQLQKLIDNSNSIDCDIVLINSVNIIKSQQKEIEELKKQVKESQERVINYKSLLDNNEYIIKIRNSKTNAEARRIWRQLLKH